MNERYTYLASLCEGFYTLNEETANRLERYAELLVEWNGKMNLTAITDPDEIIIKHFYDCLLFLKHNEIPQKAKVIDVGTGAGFPGLVLKIARPDIKITLLDSLNKRLTFLNEVANDLGLEVETLHSRAEDAGKMPQYREKYDIATARAVARLNVLSEYCLPFVKKGGSFVAMKGPTAPEELDGALSAIKKLGGEKAIQVNETLPDQSNRVFVKIKKISQTPPQFPRISAKISKKPL